MKWDVRENDSTNLLLDTVCNALGGILFIVLLIMLTVHVPPAVAPVQGETSDRGDISQKLLAVRRLELKKEALEGSIRLATRTRPHFRPEESSPPERIRKLQEGIKVEDASLAKQTKKLASARQLEEDLLGRIDGRKVALAELNLKIKKNGRVTDRRTRLPRVHSTPKGAWAVILRWGRLYVVQKHRYTYNDEDLMVEYVGEQIRFVPRRGKGMPVLEKGKVSHPAVNLLATVPSTRVYILFYTYEDSYNELSALRDAAVERGIEYNWKPLRKSEVLYASPGVGSSSVQ